MKGLMYKSEVILDVPANRVFAMFTTIKPYRTQWDLFLDKLQVTTHVSPVSTAVGSQKR